LCSPSNVFNCGGARGGERILEDLLVSNERRIRPGDLVIVPETRISIGVSMGAEVADVATRHGYDAVLLCERKSNRSNDKPYAERVRVFGLVKKVTKDPDTSHRLTGWLRTLKA
jgi:hypothetical protein